MAPGKGGYKQINKALNICAFEDYLDGQQATLPKLEDVESAQPESDPHSRSESREGKAGPLNPMATVSDCPS